MSVIFEKIVSVQNLFIAWREFCADGKRGRTDVQMFERHLEDHVFELREELLTGTYRHGPYYQFRICDPKPRTIHKATVRDRLAHHAIHRVLFPMFERSFIFDSYSCRDEKGTHAAVKRLEVFARKVSKNWTDCCWALKFDIKKFFDSVDHEILLGILERKVQDGQTMTLLREIVQSFSIQTSAPQLRGGVNRRSLPENRTTHWKFDQSIICQRVLGCI